MAKKTNFDEIILYVNKYGQGSKLLTSKEEYNQNDYLKKNNKKLKFLCENCNKEYRCTFANFKKQQKQCPQCGHKRGGDSITKNTYEVIKDYVENKCGSKLLTTKEEYTSTKKIKVLCKNCDKNIMDTTVKAFIIKKNKICNKCVSKIQGFKYTKKQEDFENEVDSITCGEYKVIGKYINNHSKILFKHNNCGNIFETTPNHFLNGVRCKKCGHGYKAKTLDEFKLEVYDLVKEEYSILDNQYINNSTKIKIKHNLCNNIFTMQPNNFLQGQRCPICKESKGEQRIRHYLEKNNIKFNSQQTFKDLYSDKGYSLRYDFAILDNYNNIQYLIEYDGKQHYEQTPNWQSDLEFARLQTHDKMKNQYSINNNIPLIRISYKEFDNIENILGNIINTRSNNDLITSVEVC